MAFNRGNTLRVTFTIADQQRKGYCSFYIGELTGQLPNINDGEFVTFISDFAIDLANVTDCYIESVSCSFDFFNDANITFGAAPDVERKAVLTFKTEDNFTTIFTIPGAKYAMFATDGETVRSDDPNALGAFTGNALRPNLSSIHDKLVNGVTINLGTYPVTDRREKDVRQLKDAYKQHRSNSRG
jgi:hypothetical protein